MFPKVYLYACDSVRNTMMANSFALHNEPRPHAALDDKTSDKFYFNKLSRLILSKIFLRNWSSYA